MPAKPWPAGIVTAPYPSSLASRVTALESAPLPEYADNAAAIADGLEVGERYQTAAGDVLIVVTP